MNMHAPGNPVTRQIYFAVIVVIATAIALAMMFRPQDNLSLTATTQPAVSVEVMKAGTGSLNLPIKARGIIEPEKQLTLVSQVVGTVTHISEHFVAGGSFSKGDILLQVDPAYLNLELQKARSAYAQASYHEQEARAQVEAGSLLQDKENLSELALGKPQLAIATSAKDAALAAVQVAEKQLENATLRAPFNGRVMTRNIQEQEQLVPGRPLAQIYSTDSYLIRIPLTQEQLAQASIPGKKNGPASTLLIRNEATGQQWTGRLLRSEGFIAPNRLIYVIGKVAAGKSSLDELIPGSLLQVDISSQQMHNLVKIPSRALHDNSQVWIADANNRAHIKTVGIAHRSADAVYISSGLALGDRVITSAIDGIGENSIVTPVSAGTTNSNSGNNP